MKKSEKLQVDEDIEDEKYINESASKEIKNEENY